MLRKSSYYFLVTTLWLVLTACSPVSITPDNGLAQENSHFPAIKQSFSQYLTEVEDYLVTNSLAQRSQQQILLNMPFELTANPEVLYKGRFLLFHGLNDSPFVWQDFAKVIAARGFDVRAVLLPGHGSHPKNMLQISDKDWFKAAQEHYDAWVNQQPIDVSPIYIGGFSLGGLLATNLALDNPQVAGLLLVSPAFHSKLNNMLSFAWLYSKFRPWLFGGMITEDNPTKYNSIAINGATAYYKATQELKAKWHKPLKMPVLMLHTVNDSVVDVAYSVQVFREKINGSKKLLLFAPIKELARKQRFSSKRFEQVINSYYPALRVLNQSHLSLINSPSNLLLGENASQLICNGNKYPIYQACMQSSEHWYGAQHTESPDGVAIARTTYNPDFLKVVVSFEEIFVH